MSAIFVNNLIAFKCPSYQNAFRITFETETPDVILGRLNSESISPIAIYLTKEVRITAKDKQNWLILFDKLGESVRPESQWRVLKSCIVDAIFGIHIEANELPPFLDRPPNDEARARSTESECKPVNGDESEDDTPVAPMLPPAGLTIPLGAIWVPPTRKGFSRNLWECFPNGTRIWHAGLSHLCYSKTAIPHLGGWFGQYDSSINMIIGEADGKKYQSISAFATTHSELHGCEKQSGWATCKYYSDGEWKDVGTIKV